MSQDDVPSAIVMRPRPPRTPTPRAAGTVRTWIAVVVIVGAAFVCWRMMRGYWRGGSGRRHDELAARQEAAKARVGHALDGLLDDLLDDDSTTVNLTIRSFAVDPALGGDYGHSSCSAGFTDAFADALGPDVVAFSGLGMAARAELVLTAKITPHGAGYQLPHDSKVYPGIAMTADMELIGKHVHADVTPGASVEFTHYVTGLDLGGSQIDVASGIVQGTCKQAGLALVTQLTGWKPRVARKADPIADCERGFHCRDNAIALLPTDRPNAAVMFARACSDGDDEACALGASVWRELSGADDQVRKAGDALRLACMDDRAGPCAGAAQIALLPRSPDARVTDYDEREALLMLLRACDLGDAASCTAASPLVGKRGLDGTPFPAGAAVLAGKGPQRGATLFGAALGDAVVFAVKWGQWERLSQGQPTAWVASKRALDPARFSSPRVAREFATGDLPKGIAAPQGMAHIYAIAQRDSFGSGSERECNQCASSGSTGTFRTFDCVCVVTPKP